MNSSSSSFDKTVLLGYKSCIEIERRSILPPLMTKEKREEAARYRQLAIEIEMKKKLKINEQKCKKEIEINEEEDEDKKSVIEVIEENRLINFDLDKDKDNKDTEKDNENEIYIESKSNSNSSSNSSTIDFDSDKENQPASIIENSFTISTNTQRTESPFSSSAQSISQNQKIFFSPTKNIDDDTDETDTDNNKTEKKRKYFPSPTYEKDISIILTDELESWADEKDSGKEKEDLSEFEKDFISIEDIENDDNDIDEEDKEEKKAKIAGLTYTVPSPTPESDSEFTRKPSIKLSPELLKSLIYPSPNFKRPKLLSTTIRVQMSEIEKYPELMKKFEKFIALVKGYLVRRIIRTERVQHIIKTIRDTVDFILELHNEEYQYKRTFAENDEHLKRRLLQQLTGACASFHDIFFKISSSERMSIIASDRKNKRANEFKYGKFVDSYTSPRKPMSQATKKSMERRVSSAVRTLKLK